MYKRIFHLFVLAELFLYCNIYSQNYIYKNPRYSVDIRVNDLMEKMTLEEKVNQLQSQMLLYNQYKSRNFNVGNVRNIAHFMHIDHQRRLLPSECANAINEDTRKSIEASRWGIPVLQNGEALHGAQWGNATSFPQSIAMAATFDDSLYYQVGQAVAKELRAVGVRQVFAPVVNISRDQRWGRVEETYGEDVCLTSRMGVAYVKALENGGIIATLKHFVDNYGEGGHDSYASNSSWRVLRETFLEPFRACIEDGGAQSVMAAYNSIDGIPCTANKVLLDDILRKDWNFNGFVVSDYGGVNGVFSTHHIANNYRDAQLKSFLAGVDIELPNGYPDLLSLVNEGKISEEQINKSVRRVLKIKFELGLFDNPYVNAKTADKIVGNEKHQVLAKEAANKCMTLLKNNGVLPLSDKHVHSVGVLGPSADIVSLGDYDGPYGGRKGDNFLTPYQALKQRLLGKADVLLYHVGENFNDFIKKCDVVIFFGAINEGEGGDRSKLVLPSKPMKTAKSYDNALIVKGSDRLDVNVDQEKMILDLANSHVKTIVVLQNGSMVDVKNWINKIDALLEAWYPGEQGAAAIAGTLFGDNNPGGHLPFTWAKDVGQLPMYYSIKPSGRGYDYNDDDGKPMFPFGYGLSYTSFEYSNLILPSYVEKDSILKVKFTLKNTGKLKGDEVVQLYIKDEHASVVRPVIELKAFKRITLDAGKSRQIILSIPYNSFGVWNSDMHYVVEPRPISVYISSNAQCSHLSGTIELR